jgi:Domain of unknown function (DUF4878)
VQIDMARRAALGAVLAAALALAACGGGGGDEGKVKETVNGFYDALGSKDARGVCDSLAVKQRRSVASSAGAKGRSQSCEKVMGTALAFVGDRLKQAKDVKVADVSTEGDKATATVELKGKKDKLGLIKEGGDWKVNTFNFGKGG